MAKQYGWGPRALEEIRRMQKEFGRNWKENTPPGIRKKFLRRAQEEWNEIHGSGYRDKIIRKRVRLAFILAAIGTGDRDQ